MKFQKPLLKQEDKKLPRCRVCMSELSETEAFTIKDLPLSANSFSDTKHSAMKRVKDLKLYQCGYCSVVQLAIKPVKNFKQVVRSSIFSDYMSQYRLDQMSKFIANYNLERKNLLEIGCNQGEFLHLFNQNLNAKFYGCEHFKSNVENSRVLVGYLGDTPLSFSKKFDGFFSFNVFEHWPTWKKIVNNLSNSLSEEAFGIIEVPNANYILNKGLYNEVIPDHLYYFTAKSFVNSLEIAGFEVLNIRNILSNYVLSAEVRLPSDMSFVRFKSKYKLNLNNIKMFFKNTERDIVIWGAGHQALATLSTIGNSKNLINYVVDSSPLKVGLFTPGTGLEVFSPEKLFAEKRNISVIVICGAYNQEVIRTIKEWNRKNIKILVMNEGKIEEFW